MDDQKLIPGTAVQASVVAVSDRVQRLVTAFFAGRNERTLRAYRADLKGFTSFLNVVAIEEAARLLLGRGHGEANGLAHCVLPLVCIVGGSKEGIATVGESRTL